MCDHEVNEIKVIHWIYFNILFISLRLVLNSNLARPIKSLTKDRGSLVRKTEPSLPVQQYSILRTVHSTVSKCQDSNPSCWVKCPVFVQCPALPSPLIATCQS